MRLIKSTPHANFPKKVILLAPVAALSLKCGSCNNPPPSSVKDMVFPMYMDGGDVCPRRRARAKYRINCAESHLQCR